MSDFFKRASVAQKIFWVAASFSLPLAVLLYLMVSNMMGTISFAQKEIKGNETQAALARMLDATSGHAMATMSCDADCASIQQPYTEAVNKALNDYYTLQARYQTDLELHSLGLVKRNRLSLQFDEMKKKWSLLETAARSGYSDDVRQKYRNYVSDIRGLITHVGDNSNLILDPDLDSYYVMDVTLLAIPQMQDRIFQMAELSERLLKQGSSTAADRTKLNTMLAMFRENDLARSETSSLTAVQEDMNFYGGNEQLQSKLKPGYLKLAAAQEKLIHMVEQVVDADTPEKLKQIDRKAILQEAQQAGVETLSFWNAAAASLDSLLQARVSAWQSKLIVSLGLSIAAIIAAALFASRLGKSITAPLGELMRYLAPGATLLTVCVDKIAESSRQPEPATGEVEMICEELNAHADSMRKAILELARHVEGEAQKTTAVSNQTAA
jgi:methyl-accepting chemotaxis protein